MLFVAVMMLAAPQLSAQTGCPGCTVDLSCPANNPGGGMCDTILAPATQGVPYTATSSFYMPKQVATPFGLSPLTRVQMISVSGLPTNILWECDSSANGGNYYPQIMPVGQELGCLRFCGTTNDAPGLYPITVAIQITISTIFGPVVVDTNYQNAILVLPAAPACPTPANAWTANVTTNAASLMWTPAAGAHHYIIQGRPAGGSNWVTIPVAGGTTGQKNVFGLSNNQTYEWQVRTSCDAAETDLSPWTPLVQFTTGCPTPDSSWTMQVTGNCAILAWSGALSAAGYEIKGRRVGTTGLATVLVGGGSTTTKTVCGLQSGSTYEWMVRTWCDQNGNVKSDFTPFVQFTTLSANRLGGENDPFNTDAVTQMSIYPNPSNNLVTLDLNSEIDWNEATVVISDLAGKQVNATLSQTNSTSATRTRRAPFTHTSRAQGSRWNLQSQTRW